MKLFAYKAHTADLARRSGKITSSCIKLYRIAKMMLSMLILCCVHQMITRYSVISALGKNIGHVGEFSDVYELPPYCKCFYMYYFWSESDKLFHEIKFHACRYKHVYQLLLYGFYSFSLRFACFFSLCTLLIFCSNYLLHSKHILVFAPNVILTLSQHYGRCIDVETTLCAYRIWFDTLPIPNQQKNTFSNSLFLSSKLSG